MKGTKHLSFELPAGIDNGDYVISGEGESVPDGANGDLIISCLLYTSDAADDTP